VLKILVKYAREYDERQFERFHREAERIDKRDRVILKNEEERSVFEEVFDRRTLMTLYSLANKRAFSYLNGAISSGKEARVYWGVTDQKKDVAVKIYLTSSSDFKKRSQYVLGDPRFNRFSRDSRSVAELWARKEFTNLDQAFNAGVRVPKPQTFLGNVLVMEFIGENGVPSPLLGGVEVTKKDYLRIVKDMKLLYNKAKLVHADLSEYNVFKLYQEIVIFDFGSAVSIEHPLAKRFLERDIENINRFFEKRSVKVDEKERLFSRITRSGERKSKGREEMSL
jgi:RIO kinase 1